MPEDQERRSNKRVHSIAMGYIEDDENAHCPNKIMELFEENTKKFTRQNFLVSQVKERKKSSKRQAPKKKIEREPIVSNRITQRLKQFITDQKKGKEVKLVIQKPLFASDLEKSQNRLNIPIKQVETDDFLTENEKKDVEEGNGLEVKLLGPRLKMHEKPMVLKIWNLNSTKNYVLKTNWNNFVKENEEDLKKNTVIQVWSFRKEEKLHFAIACVKKDVDGQNDVAFSPLPPKKRMHFLYPGTFI